MADYASRQRDTTPRWLQFADSDNTGLYRLVEYQTWPICHLDRPHQGHITQTSYSDRLAMHCDGML